MSPTAEQSQQMLQALLEDRFGLKVRKETKDGQIYALVVAKDGAKLKLSADQTPIRMDGPPGAGSGGPGGPGGAGGPPPGAGVRTGGPGGPGPGGAPPPPGFPANGPLPRGIMMMGLGQIRGTAQPVTMLLGPLTNQLGRKVVDKTNLTGLYDIELKWTPDQLPNGGAVPPGVQLPAVDPNGPSLFVALQEQLGLKLESTTGPIETYVIDKVEKLSEN
jgi:uncharacterized protein (TIGR03435 family)